MKFVTEKINNDIEDYCCTLREKNKGHTIISQPTIDGREPRFESHLLRHCPMHTKTIGVMFAFTKIHAFSLAIEILFS